MDEKFAANYYREGVEYKITGKFVMKSGREKKVIFDSCYVIDGVWHRKWFYIPDNGNPEDRGADRRQELGWDYKPLDDDFIIESIEKVVKPNE